MTFNILDWRDRLTSGTDCIVWVTAAFPKGHHPSPELLEVAGQPVPIPPYEIAPDAQVFRFPASGEGFGDWAITQELDGNGELCPHPSGGCVVSCHPFYSFVISHIPTGYRVADAESLLEARLLIVLLHESGVADRVRRFGIGTLNHPEAREAIDRFRDWRRALEQIINLPFGGGISSENSDAEDEDHAF